MNWVIFSVSVAKTKQVILIASTTHIFNVPLRTKQKCHGSKLSIESITKTSKASHAELFFVKIQSMRYSINNNGVSARSLFEELDVKSTLPLFFTIHLGKITLQTKVQLSKQRTQKGNANNKCCCQMDANFNALTCCVTCSC